MGKGSYRGGGNLLGWNANRYVAPSLTGRTRGGKALVKALTARTAQSREELAAQDERARKRHGLKPGKPQALTTATAASAGATGMAEAARKRLKAKGGHAFSVTVVRKKRRKGPG